MSFVKGQPRLSGPNLLTNPMDFSLLPQDKANSSHQQYPLFLWQTVETYI